MKLFKKIFLAITIFFVFCISSCVKGSENPPCVGPIKAAFINTRATPVRMEMATAFDAQSNPINPLFVIELPAYGTERREYQPGTRYKVQWRRSCATTCVVTGFGDVTDFSTCVEVVIEN